MSTENTNTVELIIPESIVLGGVTYRVSETPELSSLLDTARKVIAKTEKQKLYTQINELQNDIKTLSSKAVVPAEPTDFNKLKGDIVEELSKTFKPLLDTVTRKTEFLEATQVEAYRNKLIQENQGECYPELVVGKTGAELDAALKSSKELWQKYQSGKPTNTPANTTVAQPAPTPTVAQNKEVKPLPTTSRIPAPTSDEDVDIAGMSQEEFVKRRDELEKKVKALVA